VSKVAPHFHERRILKMFREALMTGNDDETIGPEAFVDVCKKHGLVQLIDVHAYREGELSALCHHLHLIDDDDIYKISTGTQTDAMLPAIDKSKSAKNLLSKSVKAVTAIRMSSKMTKYMNVKNNDSSEAVQDDKNTNTNTSINTNINTNTLSDTNSTYSATNIENNKSYRNNGGFDDNDSVNTNTSSINSETNTNTSDSSLQRVIASFQSSKLSLHNNLLTGRSHSTDRSKLDIFLPAKIQETITNNTNLITNSNSDNYSNIENTDTKSIKNNLNMKSLVSKVRNDDQNSMVIRHTNTNDTTNRINNNNNNNNYIITTNTNTIPIPIKSEVSHLKLPKMKALVRSCLRILLIN
jgi:hypothetical protein